MYLDVLLETAENNNEKFNLYMYETMSERYHFSRNPGIVPIYIVPR